MNQQDLERLAVSLGIEWELEIQAMDLWRLNHIKRTRRNRGAGELVIRALNAAADEAGARIYLRAEPDVKRLGPGDRKTRRARLIRFYEGLGFVVWSRPADMVRMPRAE